MTAPAPSHFCCYYRGWGAGAAGRSDSGATLVELMVALAVAIAIVGLAVPALRSAQGRLELDRQVDAVVHLLEAERLRALRRNEVVIVSDALRAVLAADDRALPSFTFRPDGSGNGGQVRIGSGTHARIIGLDPLTSRPRVYAAR